MAFTRTGPSSSASERASASTTAKVDVTAVMPSFERAAMPPVRKVIEPSAASRGWGRVIFVSSESALAIPVDMIDYGMTKTAQLAISRGIAESVAGTGVTVNAVLPGPTNSEIMSNWMMTTAASEGVTQAEAEQRFLKTMRPTSLLGRFTTTDEIANMVVYLCSEQASGTTGAALRVDGGVLRQIA
jgi:NAD(P)-dependent dehydrogenase (short-subunit alcohol dehydrogenase family)